MLFLEQPVLQRRLFLLFNKFSGQAGEFQDNHANYFIFNINLLQIWKCGIESSRVEIYSRKDKRTAQSYVASLRCISMNYPINIM